MQFTNPHEEFCYNTATSFSAVRGFGANRTRKDFETFNEAKAFGATYGDNRTMVYAINDLGNYAHICNA